MKYCLFLIYTPVDLEASLRRLRRYLSLGGGASKIIVINNGPQTYSISADNVELIQGDNTFNEFSGWALGKQYLTRHYTLKAGDTFCIVNDTFDKNHYFSWWTGFLYFLKSTCIARRQKGYILGRVDSREIEFHIDKLALTKWVSSYFFVVDFHAFNQLVFLNKRICTSVTAINADKIEFDSEVVDDNLSQHINGWLRPVGKGWYMAASASQARVESKSIAILHEKFISAKLNRQNIGFFHVYSGVIGKIVRRIERKLQARKKRKLAH